ARRTAGRAFRACARLRAPSVHRVATPEQWSILDRLPCLAPGNALRHRRFGKALHRAYSRVCPRRTAEGVRGPAAPGCGPGRLACVADLLPRSAAPSWVAGAEPGAARVAGRRASTAARECLRGNTAYGTDQPWRNAWAPCLPRY